MGSVDDKGIYVYDETDQVAPLHTLLNLGTSSIATALGNLESELTDGIVQIKVAANEAERNAYQNAMTQDGRPPSTQNPLYVDRTDMQVVERNDGTGWQPVFMHTERWTVQWASFSSVPPGHFVYADQVFTRPFLRDPNIQLTVATAPGGTAYMVPKFEKLTPNGFRLLMYNLGPTPAAWTSPLKVNILATG